MRLLLWLTPALASLLLDFTVHRGNSINDRAIGRQTYVKRDNVATDLRFENEKLFYITKLKVGSRGDELEVVVDTENADTWVPASDCAAPRRRIVVQLSASSSTVQGGISTLNGSYEDNIPKGEPTPISFFTTGTASGDDYPTDLPYGLNLPTVTYGMYSISDRYACTKHGSYATGLLDSYSLNSSLGLFYAASPYDSYAVGYYVNDDVSLGGHTVKQLAFAACSNTNRDIGTLGLGFAVNEVTLLGYVKHYYNLPIRLRQDGTIRKIAYSVFLNEKDHGSLLFWAVDHSKYSGQLQRVQMLNRFKIMSKTSPVLPEIALSSILGDGFSVRRRIAVSLASRNSGNTLPEAYTSELGKRLNGTLNSYGYWAVSCDLQDVDDKIVFDFSGAKIKVPVSDLVVESESGSSCFLNIRTDEMFPSLGDSFLRNAYVVYDMEDYEVALAQAADGSSEVNIEEISNAIPSAVAAEGFNDTSVDYYLNYTGTLWETFAADDASITSLFSSLSKGMAPAGAVGPIFSVLSALCAMLFF